MQITRITIHYTEDGMEKVRDFEVANNPQMGEADAILWGRRPDRVGPKGEVSTLSDGGGNGGGLPECMWVHNPGCYWVEICNG